MRNQIKTMLTNGQYWGLLEAYLIEGLDEISKVANFMMSAVLLRDE